MEDVVRVSCADQVLHWQPHPLGVIAGQNVAKIPCWDTEAHSAITIWEEPEIRIEIIRDLEHDPCPVDGVHGAEAVGLLEVQVAKEALDDVLAVVERALDRDAVHVAVEHARHLLLLDLRHAALWKQDEALHVLLAAHPVNGRAARVPTRGAQHREPARRPLQEVLVEVAEGLKRHVLERESWPVEQLHDVQVAVLHRRHDVGVLEGRVAPAHQLAQVRRWDLVLPAVQRRDLVGQLVEL
mmetsp:Transcript_54942/g.146541  ORF Transcript_54942/g.146541 Transcript_54942/m.146541 type:complete len:240 (+) Transcript_54942:1089-1808(+)